MAMLAMTILIHFWVAHWDTEPPKVQNTTPQLQRENILGILNYLTVNCPKVDQDGHGQHGHGRILLNDAANCKVRFLMRDIIFLRPETGRAPGALSVSGLKKKYPS